MAGRLTFMMMKWALCYEDYLQEQKCLSIVEHDVILLNLVFKSK